ncbi:MAG: DEAD/DEAH box helicase [Methanomicrobiales archaeon]|nr:DEAD/DEAH box helicase [Methanomicrobiales archaeon]
MPVPDLIASLEKDPRLSPRVAHVRVISAREASYRDPERPLPPVLQRYLDRKGIRLYAHQAEALECLRAGGNLIITTPTASGKTLAFNLPIFEALLEHPEATALYLYPTKALANDQLRSIRDLEEGTGIATGGAIYDGDTPSSRRPLIRERSRVILSNPYELHQVLPWHHRWERFFRNLSFVVIDEAHRYRGVFGSHMAFLIRRLRRIARHYGADPRFVLSTATIANPREFGRNLTGHEYHHVHTDGSPRGRKHFVLYNPFPDGVNGRSVHRETESLLLSCLSHDLQTLCFTVSRRMAELIALWAHEDLARKGLDPGQVTAYRAGYLPEERRAIEDRLKSGRLRGLTSTNALEVGIDIGGLDAVLISGFPGTFISTWQQAGRAGRRGRDSAAVLVAFQDLLDQYFMRHPDTFFGTPHEHAIVDLGNPYIVSGHLLCAASELPVRPDRDKALWPGDLEGPVRSLSEAHLLRETPHGVVYCGRGRAAEAVKLDSVSSETFRMTCNGTLLETLDRAQAFREAHEGAVVLHRGETYLVREMDLDTRRIRVERADVDYYTDALKSADLRVVREISRREGEGFALSLGDVEVTEQYTGYRIMKYDALIGFEPLNLPPLKFGTRALWFTLSPRVAASVSAGGLDLAGSLHGAEHALIGVAPFHVLCDRRDLGGLSTPAHPDTDGPAIFVYDGYEGGIGLAEKAFELMDRIARMAREAVEDCPCEAGCPACIYSPKCGNDNTPLDKGGTVQLLGVMAEGFQAARREETPDRGCRVAAPGRAADP